MRLQKSSRRWSEALCPLEAVGVVVWSGRSEVARSQRPVSTAKSQTAIAKFREHAFYEPRTVSAGEAQAERVALGCDALRSPMC
jgi:hypothetical protein